MVTNSKPTYLKLMEESDKLRKEAEALRKKEVTSVIVEIINTLNTYAIPPEELAAYGYGTKDALRAANGKARGKSTEGESKGGDKAKKSLAAPVKYRDPKTGASWSGRGRAPAWIVAYDNAGKKREQFLVEQAPTPQE